MFYTGLDPRDMKSVYVPKSPEEKEMQRALMQYDRPQNRAVVIKALRKAGRSDLIGRGPKCLVSAYETNKKKAGEGNGPKPSASSSGRKDTKGKFFEKGASHVAKRMKSDKRGRK